jgi:hypothetical protein
LLISKAKECKSFQIQKFSIVYFEGATVSTTKTAAPSKKKTGQIKFPDQSLFSKGTGGPNLLFAKGTETGGPNFAPYNNWHENTKNP